jgi:uncharacterized protein involved in exopolysaccharide biosynthesis
VQNPNQEQERKNPTQSSPRDQGELGSYDDDEINLTDLLLVLLKRKKMIGLLVLAVAMVTAVYSLLIPKTYTATARILPPQKSESGLSGILSGGGAFESLGLSLLGTKSSTDVFVGILESRTVADMLIKKFNLHEVYNQKNTDVIYKTLADRTKTQVSRKSQIVSVSVDDRDPGRAAEMANAYVDALDQVNRTVNITEGHRKRVFLEDRVDKVKKDLVAAESALKEFQEKYKLIAIDEQAKVTIEGAARIKGEIIAAQIELEVLKKFGTERQNEAIMLKSKIAEMEYHLSRIGQGDSEKSTGSENKPSKKTMPDFYIPFSELPELGMQLARLTRDAKVQAKVFELVTSQYELAKIEEAKDMNTIQILDRAVPPETRSSPKRTQMVVLSAVVAFFIAIFLAFFLEYVDRLRTSDPERFQALRDGFRLSRGKRWKRIRQDQQD